MIFITMIGLYSGAARWWLALSPHSKMVPGSILDWGLSVWSVHVLPVYAWVLSGYSPPRIQKHACKVRGDSKLSLGVSVSMHGLVCLCVAL